MKKMLLPILLLSSAQCFASSHGGHEGFSGASAEVGFGISGASTEDLWSNLAYHGGYADHQEKLALTYSLSPNNNFTLSSSLYYLPGRTKLGYGSAEESLPADDEPFAIKDIRGIALEPGFYIAENTLSFMRLGFAEGHMIYNDYDEYIDFNHVKGFLYGLGVKHKFNEHFYLGLEAQHINFNKKEADTSRGSSSWTLISRADASYYGLSLGYTLNDSVAPTAAYDYPEAGQFYAQAGLGLADYHVHESWIDYNGYNLGTYRPQAVFSLGYSKPFDNRLNLALNIFTTVAKADLWYGLGDGVDDEVTYVGLIPGFSVEPGYHITNKSLAYLKFGGARTSVRYSNNTGPRQNIEFGSSNGFLYGAGYKHNLNQKFYLGLEGYRIGFENSNFVRQNSGSSLGHVSAKTNYNFMGVTVGYMH